MARTILIDTHDTKRRLLQNGVPLLAGGLILAGIAVMVPPVRATGQGTVAVVMGVALLAWSPWLLLRWDVQYKGHAIRFQNSVLFGEQLYIDGLKITQGILGFRKTLQGVIRDGEGAGDRIRAESEAGLTIFRIRIVAETR
jgi:hypothetical protein